MPLPAACFRIVINLLLYHTTNLNVISMSVDQLCCAVHRQQPAVACCVECGRPHCAGCVTRVEGEPFCEICWERILSASPRPEPAPATNIPELPWLQWRERGVWNAFWETAFQSVIQPGRFFSKIQSPAGLNPALIFAAVCILFIWFPLNLFYIKVLIPPMLAHLSEQVKDDPASMEQIAQWQGHFDSVTLGDVVLMPLMFVMNYVLLSSLVQQLFVQMLNGRQGYFATLQIRCYALIAQLCLLIPFLGIFLAEVTTLVICSRGFQTAQGLSRPRAFLVATVPIMISLIVNRISM